MWDQIAIGEMGDQKHMGVLIRANPGQESVLVFSAGIVLVVPDVPAPTPDETKPPWRAP